MSEPMSAERLAGIRERAEESHKLFGTVDRIAMFATKYREDVPALLAEIERLTSENEAFRHIIASMDREQEIYAANGLRVKVVDGRVAVEYEGGELDG